MSLPYQLQVQFENGAKDAVSGTITVTVHAACTCRRLLLWPRHIGEGEGLSAPGAQVQTLVRWHHWHAGETYAYRFCIAGAAPQATWHGVETEVHRAGEPHFDPPQTWTVPGVPRSTTMTHRQPAIGQAGSSPRSREHAGSISQTRAPPAQRRPAGMQVGRRGRPSYTYLVNRGTVMVFLFWAMLIASLTLQRSVLVRANLGSLLRSNNGRFVLEDVPLDAGERYTIYLDYLPGFSFPPQFNAKTMSPGELPATLTDGEGQTIKNTMRWRTTYGTLQTSAAKIAEFRASKNGPATLNILVRERLNGGPSNFEVVIRRSRYANVVLLILSDWTNAFVLVALLIWSGLRRE